MTSTTAIRDGRYPGGKNAAGTFQWLIGMMPTHARYAEPFAGSFAVGRRKAPALESYALDLDPTPINWLATLGLPGLRPYIGCGLHWLETVAPTWDADDLVYCDPPYLSSTRVKQTLYARELTDDDHVRLLWDVERLTCRVMLSAYPHPLYSRVLDRAGWRHQTRRVITRGGTWADEVLWTNYDPAAVINFADLRYTSGATFRQRWNVQKRVAKMQARFADRPTPELAAMAAGLLRLIDRRVRGNTGEPFPRPERVLAGELVRRAPAKTTRKQPGSKRPPRRCELAASTTPRPVVS